MRKIHRHTAWLARRHGSVDSHICPPCRYAAPLSFARILRRPRAPLGSSCVAAPRSADQLRPLCHRRRHRRFRDVLAACDSRSGAVLSHVLGRELAGVDAAVRNSFSRARCRRPPPPLDQMDSAHSGSRLLRYLHVDSDPEKRGHPSAICPSSRGTSHERASGESVLVYGSNLSLVLARETVAFNHPGCTTAAACFVFRLGNQPSACSHHGTHRKADSPCPVVRPSGVDFTLGNSATGSLCPGSRSAKPAVCLGPPRRARLARTRLSVRRLDRRDTLRWPGVGSADAANGGGHRSRVSHWRRIPTNGALDRSAFLPGSVQR